MLAEKGSKEAKVFLDYYQAIKEKGEIQDWSALFEWASDGGVMAVEAAADAMTEAFNERWADAITRYDWGPDNKPAIYQSITLVNTLYDFVALMHKCGIGDMRHHEASISQHLGMLYMADAFDDPSQYSFNDAVDAFEKAYELYEECYSGGGDVVIGNYVRALFMLDRPSIEQDNTLFALLNRCTTLDPGYFSDYSFIYFSLGWCYLDGRGCSVDDGAAHECFLKAQENGADCSQILANFKKKLFGGWVFRR